MFRARPLRLGNFSAVLEMLGDDLDFEADGVSARAPDGPWRSSDQVQYAFDHMPEAGSGLPPGWASRVYGEAPAASAGRAYTKVDAKPRPEPPPPRPKSELEIVTEELRLETARTAADLKRIRRRYALRNHPDRVPPAGREEATRRMTIANTLIDHALKELGR